MSLTKTSAGTPPEILVVEDGPVEAELLRRWSGSEWRGEIVNCYKDGRLGTEQTTITALRGDHAVGRNGLRSLAGDVA